MAMLSSTAVSIPACREKSLIGPPFQLRKCTLPCGANRQVFCAPSGRIIVAQYGIPDEMMMKMKAVKEHLWKSLPDTFKDFPWKKVEEKALHMLLSLGKQTLKWSFLTWFCLSFLSDIMSTMSRNHELVMPFGLFAGFFLSNFLEGISEELFQEAHVKDINWKFMAIASVFVFIKLVSVFFGIQGRLFVAHVSNGGLMQTLWSRRRSQEDANYVDTVQN